MRWSERNAEVIGMAPLRAVLATRNLHKVQEVGRIMADAGAQVALIGAGDLACELPEVVEDGASFSENALLKARSAAQTAGMVALADDSGLSVDALAGMPGIFSARWAGGHGDDERNLDLLLDQLRDVPNDRLGAHFTCVAAAVFPDGRELIAHGQVDGSLIRARRGSGGFGYDPIFVPCGFSATTAEMEPAEKDMVSHRGAAFRQLAQLLALVV